MTVDKDYFEGRSVEVHDLRSRDSKAERSLLRKAVGVAALVLAVGMLLASLGCASVPQCETVEVHAMDTPGGRLYFLDHAGLMAMAERMQALQEGRCKLGS